MSAPATNTITPDTFQRVRDTRLDLPVRLAAKATALGADPATVLAVLEQLQVGLTSHLRKSQEWDRAHGIPTNHSGTEDLTLGNAVSWAHWVDGTRTIVPLDPHAFPGRVDAETETHSDVAATDRRWQKLLPLIHADVMLISINWGAPKPDERIDVHSFRYSTDFLNFHWSTPKPAPDDHLTKRVLRFLQPYDGEEFTAQHLYGGYITDLYKGMPTPTQAELATALDRRVRRIFREVMLELLELELEILRGSAKPVLACLGRAVEGPVRKHFEPLGYQVKYVPHHSGAAGAVQLTRRCEAWVALDAAVAEEKKERRG